MKSICHFPFNIFLDFFLTETKVIQTPAYYYSGFSQVFACLSTKRTAGWPHCSQFILFTCQQWFSPMLLPYVTNLFAKMLNWKAQKGFHYLPAKQLLQLHKQRTSAEFYSSSEPGMNAEWLGKKEDLCLAFWWLLFQAWCSSLQILLLWVSWGLEGGGREGEGTHRPVFLHPPWAVQFCITLLLFILLYYYTRSCGTGNPVINSLWDDSHFGPVLHAVEHL